MIEEIKTFESRKEELIKQGKEKGFITYEELAQVLKGLELDSDNLDSLYNAFVENGIEIVTEDVGEIGDDEDEGDEGQERHEHDERDADVPGDLEEAADLLLAVEDAAVDVAAVGDRLEAGVLLDAVGHGLDLRGVLHLDHERARQRVLAVERGERGVGVIGHALPGLERLVLGAEVHILGIHNLTGFGLQLQALAIGRGDLHLTQIRARLLVGQLTTLGGRKALRSGRYCRRGQTA